MWPAPNLWGMQHMSNRICGELFPRPPFFCINKYFILFLSLLIISGCIEESKQLEFQTVDQGDNSGYSEMQPKFQIASTQENWYSLLNSYFQGQIKDVNLEEFLVVAAFMGVKDSSGYGVSIEKISQAGKEIEISIEFKETTEKIVFPASTQPYHIVKIKKALINKGDITFIFKDTKGNLLAKEKKFIS